MVRRVSSGPAARPGWTAALLIMMTVAGASGPQPAAVPAGRHARAAAKEGIDLTPRWMVGKTYVRRVETDTETAVPLPGGSDAAPVALSMTQEIAFHVLRQRPGGGLVIEARFLGLRIGSRRGGATTRFDSTAEAIVEGHDPIAAFARDLLRTPLTAFLGAGGLIERIEGVDALLERHAPREPEQGRSILEQLVSEDAIRSRWSSWTAYGLPGRRVRPGDAWPYVFELPSLGSFLVFNATCVFRGWEQGDLCKGARVVFEGTLSSRRGLDGPSAGAAGLAEGRVSGWRCYDPDVGMWVMSEATVETRVEVPAADGSGGTRPVMLRGTQRVRDRLLRVEIDGAGEAPEAAAPPTVAFTSFEEAGVVVRVDQEPSLWINFGLGENRVRFAGLAFPGGDRGAVSRIMWRLLGQSVVLRSAPDGVASAGDGSLLRCVCLADGTLVNDRLVREGLAIPGSLSCPPCGAPPAAEAASSGAAAAPPRGDPPVVRPDRGDATPFHAGLEGVTNPEIIPASRTLPHYPEKAKQAGRSGQVVLQAVIRKDGSVTDLLVLNSSDGGFGFDDAAREAVQQWRYRPALKDGAPVDAYFTVVVDFVVQSRPAGGVSGPVSAGS